MLKIKLILILDVNHKEDGTAQIVIFYYDL